MPSRSEAKRLAAAARATAEAPSTVTSAQVAYLASYIPDTINTDTWQVVRSTHREVMLRSGIKGDESFKKRSRELARYLADRHDDGLSIAVADALTFDAIDTDYATRGQNLSERSRNDRRSRLRQIAVAVNPGLDAPPRPKALGHQAVRPPYDRVEELAIQRVALRQRLDRPRQQLCISVGLCAGAGLDSVDLRDLRRRHIDDRHDDGIIVEVPGNRSRTTVVRREYEPLVRAGLEGLGAGDLVIGKSVTRRNIVGAVVERAEILDDVPHIEASRLRSTWLAWLMERPVPLNVILDAAGLKTARSLIDLLPYLNNDQDGAEAGIEVLR